MRLPLTEDFYALDSLPANAQRLVNMAAEALPPGSRSGVMLRSTPGLVADYNIGTGPILEMNAELSGRVYLLSGSHFWRMKPDAEMAPEDLGDVGAPAVTPSGITTYATIAVGVTQAVICVPPNAWYCDHNDEILTQITDVNFTTTGASSVAYLDGFFVFTDYADDGRFFCSHLLDASTYDALAFAYADGTPNVVRRIIRSRGNLWLMGESGLEAWYDAGLANFPFTKRNGSDIAFPSIAPQAVRVCDDSVFFLSYSGVVYRIDGTQATRISTFAIEAWILSNNDLTDVDAFSYALEGHDYYLLSFTGANPRTFVYDVTMKRWHERASGAGATGVYRGRAAVNRGGFVLIGDRVGNALFSLFPNVGQDAGVQLTRIVTLPPIWAQTQRAYMARVELEMQPGIALTDTQVHLQISDDGGLTYRTRPDLPTSGGYGDTTARTFWTRLGSFRQRVLRFVLNDVCFVYGVDVETDVGK